MLNKKIKIQIKSLFGNLLFEYSCLDNTIKKTIERANLRGANLQGANLQGANLREANLRGANLRGANLRGANLQGANLWEANLRGADLREANLRGADIRGANLQGANLWEANLRGADLREANLQGANIQGANLQGANLWEANLRGANLRGANLWGAKNVSGIYKSDLHILKAQKGKLRAFKYLDGDKSPYEGVEYKVGKVYSVKDYDANEKVLCGKGLNVATLDWCLRDTNSDLSKTYLEVEFDVKDIVAIPYFSDGKFRVKKFKIVRKLTKKELEKEIKSIK